jgi:hypothetical protein
MTGGFRGRDGWPGRLPLRGMNVTKLILLALCAPLAACDLLDVEDDPTSAADDGAEESGGEASDGGESGAEDPGDEDPSDEESDGGDDVDSSSGGDDPDDPPSDVPADLIGSWYTGNGETHLETIDLFTDATYLEERKGEGPIDGCYTRYTQQLAGEYVVSGEVIELQPTTSHLWVDACGTAQESDEVPATGVFDFQLGADEWGYTLRLTPAGGAWKDSILYHRL